MPAPPNSTRPIAPVRRPAVPRETSVAGPGLARDDAVICERCGAEMFRMHAVWRCPACRYKTDCCGW
ncbi:MAG: hypothetical protein F4137_01240 [Acidobacteria bacterium]|nr:hypothetical protein [Acidobacteriota bacterium]MYH27492.1 hypothetical protein [Acidobacteriota bacterium]